MKKYFWGTGIGLVILLLIGTFFDLSIDKALFVGTDNWFSVIFYNLAPSAFGWFLVFGGTLLFWTLEFKKDNKFLIVVYFLLYVLMAAQGLFMAFGNLSFFGVIVGLVIAVGTAYVAFKMPRDLARRYRWAGLAIILTGVCAMVTVDVIKQGVGRVRFRSMQDNFDLFTRWYQRNGNKYLNAVSSSEEIKSFPSGHSQWSSTAITLSFLAMVNPKWRKHEGKFYIVGLVYAAIVMVSRMMAGAHFLSDTTVGFAATFIFFLIFRWLVVQRNLDKYGPASSGDLLPKKTGKKPETAGTQN